MRTSRRNDSESLRAPGRPAPRRRGAPWSARGPTTTLVASPWSPPSTFAPRSRSWVASRRSPASISTSTGARSCSSRARTGPARRTLLRTLAGLLPGGLGHGRGARPRPASATGGRCAARSGLLGHATMLYDELTVADNVQLLGPGRRRRGRPTPRPRSVALGLGGRLRHVAVARLSAGQRRRAVDRRAGGPPTRAVAARRAPRRARRRGPRHGRRARPRRGRAPGPPCWWPPTSSSGATRWPGGSVTIAGGVIEAPRRRPAPVDPTGRDPGRLVAEAEGVTRVP